MSVLRKIMPPVPSAKGVKHLQGNAAAVVAHFKQVAVVSCGVDVPAGILNVLMQQRRLFIGFKVIPKQACAHPHGECGNTLKRLAERFIKNFRVDIFLQLQRYAIHA